MLKAGSNEPILNVAYSLDEDMDNPAARRRALCSR